MVRSACSAILLIGAVLGTRGFGGAPAAATRQLADKIDRHLRSGVLAAWFPRCLDRQEGGFLPDFAADWTPTGPHDKTIVFQSGTTESRTCRAGFMMSLWLGILERLGVSESCPAIIPPQ